MTKREVVKAVLDGGKPPYVPWSFGFTGEAYARLEPLLKASGLGDLGNHLAGIGNSNDFFTELGNGRVRDYFGVTWDRSVDKDIGVVEGFVLPEPSLKGYRFPDPLNPKWFADIPAQTTKLSDRFRVFHIGFSLYERAWTLRGMENLLMDFIENPEFVHELMGAITDWNVTQVNEAVKYDIDAVSFGDDWGSQRGLQMGPKFWYEYIFPHLKKMYGVARDAGKYVMIHSCGKVDELFDGLVSIGLNCFNPFQPEVMDVASLIKKYRGRLAFHGGLSTQKTLPYGTPDDVRRETRRLLDLGRDGGYIFAPAHAVPKDVPGENMMAFITEVLSQPGRS